MRGRLGFFNCEKVVRFLPYEAHFWVFSGGGIGELLAIIEDIEGQLLTMLTVTGRVREKAG
jgi:hypothetical protein